MILRRMVLSIVLACPLLVACSREDARDVARGPAADAGAAGRIEADLRFLADDLLEGREAG
jgi:hypothetical protein